VPARLPASLGHDLAARAARVAAELSSGDTQAARSDAFALRRAVVAAIDAGRVPAGLQDPLLAGATRLLSRIPVSGPLQPPPPKHEKPEHKRKKKDEKKRHGKHD